MLGFPSRAVCDYYDTKQFNLSLYSVTRPPQYDAWIDMYGGEDFEREVKDYISMVNDALNKLQQQQGEGTIGGEDESSNDSPELIIKEMEQHFIMCCKLEHMFWDQAVTMMEWPNFGL